MMWNFSPEKSDGFGWVRSVILGTKVSVITTRPPKPLKERSTREIEKLA
jgi:hypothetical protein